MRSRLVPSHLGLVAALGAIALASCGGSSEVTSATVAATVASPATSAASATTAPPATTPPTTAASTTAPPASTAPPTTAPPATTAPPTTTAEAPPADPPETVFVTTSEQLVEVSASTGEIVRVVVDRFSEDGVFRGGIRLMPDRESLWYSEGYEDSWFACESSVGVFGRLDLTTGTLETAGPGTGPEPSANGIAVATLSSEVCVPDPQNEEFWVLTPYDRVIIYLVADGDSREFVTDTPPDTYGAPGSVEWAGFSTGGNLLVMTGDGQLRNIDISGSNVIQDHPVVLPEVLGDPIAATADALLTLVTGDEGSSDLYSTDALSGEITLLASSETFMAVGVSLDEHLVVAAPTEVTVAPGAAVTVLPVVGDDEFIFDLDW